MGDYRVEDRKNNQEITQHCIKDSIHCIINNGNSHITGKQAYFMGSVLKKEKRLAIDPFSQKKDST